MDASLEDVLKKFLSAEGSLLVPLSSTGRIHRPGAACPASTRGEVVKLAQLEPAPLCATCFNAYEIKYGPRVDDLGMRKVYVAALALSAQAGHLDPREKGLLESLSTFTDNRGTAELARCVLKSVPPPTAQGAYGSPSRQKKIDQASAVLVTGFDYARIGSVPDPLSRVATPTNLSWLARSWALGKITNRVSFKRTRSNLRGCFNQKDIKKLLPDRAPFEQGDRTLAEWIDLLQEDALTSAAESFVASLEETAKGVLSKTSAQKAVTVVHRIPPPPPRDPFGLTDRDVLLGKQALFLPDSLVRRGCGVTLTTRVNARALKLLALGDVEVLDPLPRATAEILLTLYSDNPDQSVRDLAKTAKQLA